MDDVELQRAVERLAGGGLVAFPTETVYGLGADALNAGAVARVFEAKGRPSFNPLIVHVTGLEMGERVGVFDERARRVAGALWPGPLSIVVLRRGEVPDIVTGGGATVAVRCPDHPVALALLFAFGRPLVGPSANKSGGVSPTTAAHVRAAFDDRDVLTLDGGACSAGLESTVLWMGGGPGEARVLRPGVIGAEAIGAVLGEEVAGGAGGGTLGGQLAAVGPLRSPGLLTSHYAPRARCVLVDDLADLGEAIDQAGPEHDGGRPVAVVLSHSLLGAEVEGAVGLGGVRLIEMPHEASAYGAALYARLREADGLEPGVIVVHRPPVEGESAAETAVWLAIADRLARATAGG
jgi:L-threonylcarbamoyladenylate synthase